MTAFKARPTTYKGIPMRSRLEAGYASWLDLWKFTWEYEPQAFASERGQYLDSVPSAFLMLAAPDAPPLVSFHGAHGWSTAAWVYGRPGPGVSLAFTSHPAEQPWAGEYWRIG